MLTFWQLGPTDDFRSLAMRLVHFGVLGAMAGLIILALLLFLNIYLLWSIATLKAEVRRLIREVRTPWKEVDDGFHETGTLGS